MSQNHKAQLGWLDVKNCEFFDTSASDVFGGGAIYAESEEGSSLANSVTTLRVSSSTFTAASAYLGATIYSSLADVTFNDSFIGPASNVDAPTGQFFDADQSAACTSACKPGTFGNCTAVGSFSSSSSSSTSSCASCAVGVCFDCPPGRTGRRAGSTSLIQGCEECPQGYAVAEAKTVEGCSVCTPGSYTVDAQGRATSSGAVKCQKCPPNTFAPLNASTSCLSCPVEEITSVAGAAVCDRAIEGYYMVSPSTARACLSLSQIL